MRLVVGATLVALSGLSLHTLGCGSGASDDGSGASGTSDGGSGDGGAGAAGAAGGAGGEACVPEAEACDGVDNDCDDEVDEGCSCTPGDTQECYSGRPIRTKGIGACKAGTQTCGSNGAWEAACVGEVTPEAEECNSEDDDCNGMPDDMGDTTCGVGACQVTVAVCTNGQTNTCTPGMASLEVCDAIDNDCDQQTDESFPQQGAVCDTGLLGACAPGTQQCMVGVQACIQNLMPTDEACDGIDSDCNGTVDDNVPGTGSACTTGQSGVCSAGTVSCQGGTIDCFPDIPSSPEVCDGLDNDCDDQVDDGNPGSGAACPTGQPGACAAGTENCVSGAIACVPNNLGQPEVCNGVDDDCDGSSDEGNPGGGVACGCGGTTNCISGAIACQGGPIVYFEDNFANNSKGWTLGTEWAIGPTSAGCSDPPNDHTSSTSDNSVAGVVLGGCASTTLHGYYYLTSPIINTAAANTLFLEYWRWLRTDYTPYMNSTLEVYNGTTWTIVYQTGSVGLYDTSWVKQSFNIAAYKNANMRVRFGFNIGSSGVFSVGQWNVDDLTVTSTACP